jgi:LCP family protein required for cell wall assembly
MVSSLANLVSGNTAGEGDGQSAHKNADDSSGYPKTPTLPSIPPAAPDELVKIGKKSYRKNTLEGQEFLVLVKPSDEDNHIVRVPKRYRKIKEGAPGLVKVGKNDIAKTKKRVEKLDKQGFQKLKYDGNFKYGFTKARKFGLTLLGLLLATALGVGSYVAFWLFSAQESISKVTQESSLIDAVFKDDPLMVDDYGRSNILVFGTSENDETHGGADLADSILVMSINPKTGAANMISIPRDLTYKEKDYTTLCSMGSIWKINVAYLCGYERSESDDPIQKQRDGSAYMTEVIEKVTGLQIQYYAKANYNVLIDVVNTLGGIDVIPYSENDKGLYDIATQLKLPGGVPSHLDGPHALALSRARNDFGGYGLSRSNFDRELNQQRILNAIRDKASASGMLLNPQKILDLIAALGNNIITNVKASEFKSFGKAANMMRDAVTIPLLGDTFDGLKVNLVVTGTSKAQPGLGSVVVPAEGEFDFEDIQHYIREYLDKKVTKKSASPDASVEPADADAPENSLNGNYVPFSERTSSKKSSSSSYSYSDE